MLANDYYQPFDCCWTLRWRSLALDGAVGDVSDDFGAGPSDVIRALMEKGTTAEMFSLELLD